MHIITFTNIKLTTEICLKTLFSYVYNVYQIRTKFLF